LKEFACENESSVNGSVSLRGLPDAVGGEVENHSAIGAVDATARVRGTYKRGFESRESQEGTISFELLAAHPSPPMPGMLLWPWSWSNLRRSCARVSARNRKPSSLSHGKSGYAARLAGSDFSSWGAAS